MDVIAPKSQELSFENVWLLFQETDRKWQETDKRWQESEKLLTEKFQELARQQARNEELFKSIHEVLGGIGKSNGEIAEDFFYSALSKV